MRILFFLIAVCLGTSLCAWKPSSPSKSIIVLDSRFSFKEKLADDDYAFDVLQKVQAQLIEKGYTVYLTTARGNSLSMKERENFTREKEADLYFSLSFYNINATKYGRKKPGVAENYLITPVKGTSDIPETINGRALSNQLREKLSGETGAFTRVLNYTIVNDIPCPGAHLNIEFKENTDLHQKIKSPEYHKLLADAIVLTIERSFRE